MRHHLLLALARDVIQVLLQLPRLLQLEAGAPAATAAAAATAGAWVERWQR